MAILAFQKPDKVLMLEADSRFGKFELRPLEPDVYKRQMQDLQRQVYQES